MKKVASILAVVVVFAVAIIATQNDNLETMMACLDCWQTEMETSLACLDCWQISETNASSLA